MLLQPKQQHPGTAALLPGCFMETETRPSPGPREAFWSHDWEPSCALLAVLVPKQKKLLRPLGVLGATEQHPCVATESATNEVESGALLVDNQLSCNIGNLADEFISAIYQHTQRPLDWQHCTI